MARQAEVVPDSSQLTATQSSAMAGGRVTPPPLEPGNNVHNGDRQARQQLETEPLETRTLEHEDREAFFAGKRLINAAEPRSEIVATVGASKTMKKD